MWQPELLALLQSSCREMGLPLTEGQALLLWSFSERILAQNQALNLTRITDERDLVIKHLVDSATVAPLMPSEPGGSIVDIGSGGGFPGIVLKVLLPHMKVTLVDSTRKKTDFLNQTIKDLALADTRALWGRAEELSHREGLRESFDVAVSRAVGELRVLAELCLPFVKVGGILIAQKGSDCDREISAAQTALASLGGKLEKCVKFELPEKAGGRSIVVVRKDRKSPSRYPRKPGLPEKRPL